MRPKVVAEITQTINLSICVPRVAAGGAARREGVGNVGCLCSSCGDAVAVVAASAVLMGRPDRF